MDFSDIVLFPNCDLHLALHGTPPLTLQVFYRAYAADKMSYTLTPITSGCTFDFFAPYNGPHNVPNHTDRLEKFVDINPATGLVTPTRAAGINLVQITFTEQLIDENGDPVEENGHPVVKPHYILARIQVHDTILDWWFGNSSITTAKDGNFAHAQPSIYASFNFDFYLTDAVGDITGHGYVPLTSSDNSIFTVNANGRLQGVSEGKAQLNGTFLNKTKSLPVTVIDYGKPRPVLEPVRVANRAHPETMHNVLFIPEGFRNTNDHSEDGKKFNKMVTQLVDEVFSKSRHTPFNLLKDDFNVWKTYEPSSQHAVTCGYRVNDREAAGVLGKGYPIPPPVRISSDAGIYSVDALVRIVGLPLHDEISTTAQLKARWSSQSLDNFDPNRVNDNLVSAWETQNALGILEARDTFFGLYLGGRYGDRRSEVASRVPPPASDNKNDAKLAPFIKRMYEWFDPRPFEIQSLTPDPRRHPPELYVLSNQNFGSSIMKYLASLQIAAAPHQNMGQEWAPDPNPNNFKKSRGLVALIVNDEMIGGTNFDDQTITAETIAQNQTLGPTGFLYVNTGDEHILRRSPSDPIKEDAGHLIDTVAHEFGHSFGLGDEYEEVAGDDPNAANNPDEDMPFDNLARLGAIRCDDFFMINRRIDPQKVKWFDLLRIEISDALIAPSTTEVDKVKVTIDKRFIGKWVAAKKRNLKTYLRRPDLIPPGQQPPTGLQLPLRVDNDSYLVELEIGEISETNGTILLGGIELPDVLPFPVFPAGSMLFVPKTTSTGELLFVVEREVLAKLKELKDANNQPNCGVPLNDPHPVDSVFQGPDYPKPIPSLTPPSPSYKLIGIYEGATFGGTRYRPAGLCKMRDQRNIKDGEFCYVCKYLIVNRVNPALHALLDKKHFPEAKKHG